MMIFSNDSISEFSTLRNRKHKTLQFSDPKYTTNQSAMDTSNRIENATFVGPSQQWRTSTPSEDASVNYVKLWIEKRFEGALDTAGVHQKFTQSWLCNGKDLWELQSKESLKVQFATQFRVFGVADDAINGFAEE